MTTATLPEPEISVVRVIEPKQKRDETILDLKGENFATKDRSKSIIVEYRNNADGSEQEAIHESKNPENKSETGTIHPSGNNLTALTIGTGTAWQLMTLDNGSLRGLFPTGDNSFVSVENNRIGLWTHQGGFPKPVNFEVLEGDVKNFHHDPDSDNFAVILGNGNIVVFQVSHQGKQASLNAARYNAERQAA